MFARAKMKKKTTKATTKPVAAAAATSEKKEENKNLYNKHIVPRIKTSDSENKYSVVIRDC